MQDTHVIEVPAGAARFVNVYRPHRLGDELENFGMSLPTSIVDPDLLPFVRTREFEGVELVSLKSRVRPEVGVAGFEFDGQRWDWLERQHIILELRNLPRDAIFREHPSRLLVRRCSFRALDARNVPHDLVSDDDGNSWALALVGVELVREGD